MTELGRLVIALAPSWGRLSHGKLRSSPLQQELNSLRHVGPSVWAIPAGNIIVALSPAWSPTFLSKAAWRPCWVAMVTGSLPAGLPW